jgi:transposase
MDKDLSKLNLRPQNFEEAIDVIRHMAEIIITLKKENEALKEQINNNSKNSSLPPSQDIKKKKQKKALSHRKRGAQPGHKAFQRIIASPDQVDVLVDCKPEELCSCGGNIKLENIIQKHQIYEIPEPKFHVTEYKIHKGYCERCHKCFRGKLPEGVNWKGFGLHTHAMISLLTSKYRLSKRLVRDWFHDVYKMPICIGSVSNVEHTVSQSLAFKHQEIERAIRNEKIVHIDETGHKECHKNAWAWLMSTENATFFKLNRSRGKKVAKELIGNFHGRIIISDRYPAYDYLPDQNHQVCWAHLKRDFQKISERPGTAGSAGRKLLHSYSQLFHFWKMECNSELNFSKKQKRRLNYLKNKMLKWLRTGAACKHEKTARTCENILSFANSLWLFLKVPGVSPTNNHAERQLRPLVISKKLTFGTQSDRGSRYIERIFSVVTTCKQQGVDVLKLIINLVHSHFCITSIQSFPSQP